MNLLYAIASHFRPGKPQPPERNPAYLKWLTRFPCFACGEDRRPRDAAHFGAHGLSTKASDMDALPLCRACHQQFHASSRRFYLSVGFEHVQSMQTYFRNVWGWEQAGRPGEKKAA